MAELIPLPFERLVRRVMREYHERGSIFDLPASKFHQPAGQVDLSVKFHGHEAGTPLGPAAGPHSQMAQNIVLAWLGGSRIIELKTVQILDQLEIERPCIDAATIGYNIEWSQELRIEQSLEEYVKASMLIEMIRAMGAVAGSPDDDPVIFDLSVGYDLAGITTDRVRRFMENMKDASEVVDRLRGQIPPEAGRLRDLDFRTGLSRTLTLSTFHGCPPDEIERIIDVLLHELGLDCTIKLNPTLLGPQRLRELLHESLGYDEAVTPADAFACDTRWDQMLGFVDRLETTARTLGRGLGVKFSNTLIVENHRKVFNADRMYLSGQPLHVLAMNLVRDFRRAFGDRVPVSFSAGIDRVNFPDAVALGLVPVTVCTDMLRTGGYGRQVGYFKSLRSRMDEVGAANVDEYIIRAYGAGRVAFEKAGLGQWNESIEQALASGQRLEPVVGAKRLAAWVSAARMLNTELYVETLGHEERYRRKATNKPPRKIGSMLELFDCVTCDKCIPVCPNDANFALKIDPVQIPIVVLRHHGGGWVAEDRGSFSLEQRHQIGNFADFCNDCGNCDVFCPEDGGPYVLKPRFFGTREAWTQAPHLDGFFVERDGDREIVEGRFDGRAFSLSICGTRARFSGQDFDISFEIADPAGTVQGRATGEIDLGYYGIMNEVRKALLGKGKPVCVVNV